MNKENSTNQDSSQKQNSQANSQVPLRPRERHHGSGLWAAILITVGSVLLLNTLGILSWGVWATFIQFWPVLLILSGIQIILGKSYFSKIFVAVISLAVFSLIICLSLASTNSTIHSWVKNTFPIIPISNLLPQTGEKRVETVTVNSADFPWVNKRNLSFTIGAAKLSLEDNDSQNIFDLRSTYFDNFGKPDVQTSLTNNELQISLEAEKDPQSFVNFPFLSNVPGETNYEAKIGVPKLKTDLMIKIGAGSGVIKLNKSNIDKFNIELGVGSAEIDLSKDSLPTVMDLDVGVGSLKIRLPKDIGLRVKHNIGLGSLVINGQSIKGDSPYVSSGFESFQKQLQIEIGVGTGSVDIQTE